MLKISLRMDQRRIGLVTMGERERGSHQYTCNYALLEGLSFAVMSKEEGGAMQS